MGAIHAIDADNSNSIDSDDEDELANLMQLQAQCDHVYTNLCLQRSSNDPSFVPALLTQCEAARDEILLRRAPRSLHDLRPLPVVPETQFDYWLFGDELALIVESEVNTDCFEFADLCYQLRLLTLKKYAFH